MTLRPNIFSFTRSINPRRRTTANVLSLSGRSVLFLSLVMVFLLAGAQQASAQRRMYEEKKKTYWQTVKEDSVAWVNGLQLHVDLVGPITKAVGNSGHFEVGGRLSIKDRFYPAVEIGHGSTDYTEATTNTSYKAAGLYGKVGVDFNMLRDKHDVYKLFLGARYAMTSFDFDVSNPTAEDPVWGGSAGYEGKDVGCNFSWLEFLVGVDAKIYGPVSLGWTMRYKRRMSHSYDAFDKAWYVPGYGSDKGTGFGATFTVAVNLERIFKQ